MAIPQIISFAENCENPVVLGGGGYGSYLSVRELMGRVRNVVLIKCILDLGNPWGVGILGGRVHGPGEEKGS